MLEQLGAAAIRVDARGIADVVPVGLEPADHRILGVEDPIFRSGLASRNRAVVADLVRPAGWRSDIEAVATVLVVGLPRCIGGLKQQIRPPLIVSDDEGDVARPRPT